LFISLSTPNMFTLSLLLCSCCSIFITKAVINYCMVLWLVCSRWVISNVLFIV